MSHLLEIQNLQVSAGGLGVVFSGTIALDALFRPIGAGTVVIDGYRGVLETFYSSGLINNVAKAAAILTLDGVGEWTTTSLAMGKGKDISILKEIMLKNYKKLLTTADSRLT